MNEFQKSIRAILYERIVSPLSGTIFLSWIVWNWQLIYYFFIFDQGQKVVDKINYIESNFNDWHFLILYPLLSTIFFLLIYPFLSTGSYWIYLKFKEWQNNIKNSIENNTLLTLEQSVQLRLEIQNQQNKFLELEKEKSLEIEMLKKEKEQLLNEISSNQKDVNSKTITSSLPYMISNDPDFDFFMESDNVQYFDTISTYVNNSWQFDSDQIPSSVLNYYLAFGLLVKTGSAGGYFEFTEKGEAYQKEYLRKKLQEKH